MQYATRNTHYESHHGMAVATIAGGRVGGPLVTGVVNSDANALMIMLSTIRMLST